MGMKEYDLSDPRIQARPEYKALLENAEPNLVDFLGSAGRFTRAVWHLDTDEDPLGRPLFVLKLRDWTLPEGVWVSDKFAPDELRSERQARRRFHDLWGDLLHARLERSIDELRAMTAEGSAT